MYLSIVLLPLVSSVFAGLGGFLFGASGAGLLTVVLVGTTFLLSVMAFIEVGLGGTVVTFQLFPWIDSGHLTVQWGFLFDSLTVTMLVVVTGVSTLVHRYSLEYMAGDPHRQRFMSYLSRFTFFMLLRVTGDNLLQLFLGWEGVGLCSFLLINFWFTRLQANKAAIKAMLVNRVGDVGLILGRMRVFYEFGTLDYAALFGSGYAWADEPVEFRGASMDTLTRVGLFLFIGAVGKSAQLGLHTWLPDAMEGPTPVSALIHAATMVTAGVFLRARCSPILEYTEAMLTVITVFGAMTALFAATTGLLQNDLKRVIAYSTCSQLGYMVFACGVSAYSVGVFHLANHACFKALLFLSAGSVIHALADEQDMRRMGGLISLLPLSYAMFFIGSLALMGFPFLTGFYSKDIILEVAYGQFTVAGHFAYALGSLAAFFTAFYSLRLLFRTFLGTTNAHRAVMDHAHDAPIRMAAPLVILSVGSVFLGWASKDLMIGLGTSFWEHALFTHPAHMSAVDGEFLPHVVKVLPVCLSITGAVSALVLYSSSAHGLHAVKTSPAGRALYTMLNRKWMWDKVYNDHVSQAALELGYRGTYRVVDRGVIESLGPLGMTRLLSVRSTRMSQVNAGSVANLITKTAQGLACVVMGLLVAEGLGRAMGTGLPLALVAWSVLYLYKS